MIALFEWRRSLREGSFIGGRLVRHDGEERIEGVIVEVIEKSHEWRFRLEKATRRSGEESENIQPVELAFPIAVMITARAWANGLTFSLPCIGRVDITFRPPDEPRRT